MAANQLKDEKWLLKITDQSKGSSIRIFYNLSV